MDSQHHGQRPAGKRPTLAIPPRSGLVSAPAGGSAHPCSSFTEETRVWSSKCPSYLRLSPSALPSISLLVPPVTLPVTRLCSAPGTLRTSGRWSQSVHQLGELKRMPAAWDPPAVAWLFSNAASSPCLSLPAHQEEIDSPRCPCVQEWQGNLACDVATISHTGCELLAGRGRASLTLVSRIKRAHSRCSINCGFFKVIFSPPFSLLQM